jgi:hypothetical protein
MALARLTAVIMIHSRISKDDPILAQEFQKSAMPSCQYGDNSLYGFQMKFFPYVIGKPTDLRPLGYFQDIFEHSIGLSLKPSETFLFCPASEDSPYHNVSPLITVIKEVVISGKLMSYEILKDGPEFLKRKFVYMSPARRAETFRCPLDVCPQRVFSKSPYCIHRTTDEIMPWRAERDFFTRSAISTTALECENDKWCSKYMGLLVDTMGTNRVAYDAMRNCYVLSLRGRKLTADTLSLHYDLADPAFVKVMSRTGVDAASFPDFFRHPDNLYDWFSWDNKWRAAWAISRNIPLYRTDGTPYYPRWEYSIPVEEVMMMDPSF